MIIPMTCFSCGKPIAHLYDRYQQLVKQFSQQNTEGASPAFKALAELRIGRTCCRRMFLAQQDMYDP